MKLYLRKKSTCIIVIGAALTIFLLRFAYAELHLNYSAEDRMIARDLAKLSGLPEDDVFSIRGVIDDWDPITENILVYKDILDRVGDSSKNREMAFELIGQYPAGEVLTVYQYLDQNQRDLNLAWDILKRADGGESLEAILTGTADSKLYDSYRPADKEQIRKWLETGYSPQDILNADTISMSKDMKIGEVLAMKAPSVTWEAIGKRLGYEFETETTSVSLQIPDACKTRMVYSSDYAALVSEVNASAESKKTRTKDKIIREIEMTQQQLDHYQAEGHSLHDLQNARRLSQESGRSVDNILLEKSQGRSWLELVNKYHKEGKGEKQ